VKSGCRPFTVVTLRFLSLSAIDHNMQRAPSIAGCANAGCAVMAPVRLERWKIVPRSSLLLEHDLFRKTSSHFSDHALDSNDRRHQAGNSATCRCALSKNHAAPQPRVPAESAGATTGAGATTTGAPGTMTTGRSLGRHLPYGQGENQDRSRLRRWRCRGRRVRAKSQPTQPIILRLIN